jgi:hypothetical protein
MKKKNNKGGSEVGVGLAAAALALAGGYVLWEKMGKERQEKAKAWIVKARQEAVNKLADAKKMGESEYNRIVDAAVKRYGLSEGISKADLSKVAADLKGQWAKIQVKAKTVAKQLQKQAQQAKKAIEAEEKKARKNVKVTTKHRATRSTSKKASS